MTEMMIGCCGFQKSQAAYYAQFRLIEIQQTFYKPPMLKTVERWREQAPSDFIFTLKAWQLITHEPYSPTYQKAGIDLPRQMWDRYGAFRPTMEVFEAWERTLVLALALNAPVVLFQCPAQFTPTKTHVDNMRAFFERAPRRGLTFAWEPRGDWPPELIGQLCEQLNLIHCVDPFLNDPVAGDINYFRMHGGEDYSHQFSDEELDQVRGWAETKSVSYCLFNNVYMWDDATRFQQMVQASSLKGASSRS